MKKTIMLIGTLSLVVLFSCTPKSQKGKWVDADKKAAKTACETESKAEAKKNAAVAAFFTDELITKVCDCGVTKLEAEYASYNESEAADKADPAKQTAMMEPCLAPYMEELTKKMTEQMAADTTKKATADTTKKEAGK